MLALDLKGMASLAVVYTRFLELLPLRQLADSKYFMKTISSPMYSKQHCAFSFHVQKCAWSLCLAITLSIWHYLCWFCLVDNSKTVNSKFYPENSAASVILISWDFCFVFQNKSLHSLQWTKHRSMLFISHHTDVAQVKVKCLSCQLLHTFHACCELQCCVKLYFLVRAFMV